MGCNIFAVLHANNTNQRENSSYFETVFIYKFSIHFKCIFLSKGGIFNLSF